jgi:hypothetical protein
MLRFVTSALLTAAGLVVLASLIVGALFWTPWGRAIVCAQLNATITQGIAGELEVEHIDSLGFSRLVARGITIRGPDGKPAIQVQRAAIDFDLLALWSGRYGWQRAQIDDCTVHLREDKQGKINMEETFKGRPEAEKPKDPQAEKKSGDEIDLQNMVTNRCQLIIGGGSLPDLRLAKLHGIMRVHVLRDGSAELRFDDYRGLIEKGLPTGELEFEQVQGQVQTSNDRLLHFAGQGRSQGAPVEFDLDIISEPKTRVKIDAHFASLSRGSLRALGVEAFSQLSSTLDLNVTHGSPD